MTLYQAQTNSPSTTLVQAVLAEDNTIYLADTSVFSGLPLPNLLTLGWDTDHAETVIVTVFGSGGATSVTRGADGTAQAWDMGTQVARVFTALDWNSMITDKQDTVTASGVLKGNGAGGVTAATPNTDYVTPSGVPAKATNVPLMDGTAAIGNSTKWATENHVHPSDTSRVATSIVGAPDGVASLDDSALLSKAQSLLRIVSITSNTTLAATHAESLLRVNSSTARTLTIPADSSNATFPVGTCILVEQVAAGAATVQGASGVYLNGTNGGSVALSAAHTALALVKVDATHWDCWGAI